MNKINRVKIENFRGIRKLKFKPTFPVTLFIGRNGSGKTAVLDCIAGLSPWTHHKKGTEKNMKVFKRLDVKNNQDFMRILIKTGNNVIDYYINHGKKEGSLKKSLYNKIPSSGSFTTGCPDEILTVYYPVSRFVPKIYLKKENSVDLLEPTNASDGAFDKKVNFQYFFNWFRNRESFEKEKSPDGEFRDHQLQAVRQAIEHFTGLTDLRFVRSPMHMEIKKQGLSLWFDNLSDGEKCLLAMVGDIARRLAVLSGEKQDPLQSNGIVIIDEIELHLHPSWQMDIVPKLVSTFPNCQFFISTNSPQVISNVAPESVFLLYVEDGNVDLAHPESSYGQTSERILEDTMGVPSRPEGVEEKIHQIFVNIDERRLKQAKAEIETLKSLIGEDPAFVRANGIIFFLESRIK